MTQNKDKQAYRWLIGQVRPARNWLILSITLGVINALLLIGLALLLADIIHLLVMEQVPRNQLYPEFASALGLVLTRACCHWGREFCGFRAGRQVREDIRRALLNKLSRLGPLAVAARPAGSWSSVVVEQVEELQEFVAHYLPQMILAAAVPFIMLLVIFPQSWIVGMVFLITAPLIPMFMIFVGDRAAEANRRNFRALSRLGGFFLDRLQGLETLRLFQRTGHAVNQLDEASEDFRTRTMSVLRLAFLSSTILEFFASIAIALIAVYLGMNFLGHISIGGQVSLYTGLFLLLLAPDFYQPLRELGTYYHAKAKAVGAAEDIVSLIDTAEPAEHQGRKSLPDDCRFTITASNLTVYSEQSQRPLLDKLSFTIDQGERVAIIGSSGAGKSTLTNALMGFWSFQGDLQIAGQSLTDTCLASWRQGIAWLGQHPLIVHGSVYDNIDFGRGLSEQQCLDALARAQGMDIIQPLADGIYSPVNEQGSNLSVGQAQRIALARALAGPVRLLILDEPTASLDSDSEALVMQALQEIPSECTVITVTHRLGQLKSMDRVLLIDHGRLVAQGSPAELEQTSKPYQTFVRSRRQSLDHE